MVNGYPTGGLALHATLTRYYLLTAVGAGLGEPIGSHRLTVPRHRLDESVSIHAFRESRTPP